MAGVIETEIEALKAIGRCRIIKNVGDFAYVISLTVPATDVVIKLQLTGQYPTEPAVYFVRGIAKDLQYRIKTELSLSRFSGTLGQLSQCIIEKIPAEILRRKVESKDPPRKSSPKSPRSAKESYESKDGADGVKSSKKPSMRTAADVVKRVQWDSAFNKEDVIVGYVDRFLGIQEQPFMAFNWVDPAAADWMDLNIPEHRIEYFKYKNTIVWEKKTRTDKIFGSTGNETVINRAVDESSADSVELNGTAAAAETAVETTSAPTSSSEDDNDSDDDDDINVSFDICTANPMAASAVHRPTVRLNKPNHFIALPVTNEAVIQAIRSLQDSIISSSDCGTVAESLISAENLHMTLCALRIDTDDELDIVSQCLYDLVVSDDVQLPSSFRMSGLDSFWDRVMYAKIETHYDRLLSCVNAVRTSLKEKNIKVFDEDGSFVPHVTILKFYRNQNSAFSISNFISKNAESSALEFGEQVVDQLSLFSMTKDESGHYVNPFNVSV